MRFSARSTWHKGTACLLRFSGMLLTSRESSELRSSQLAKGSIWQDWDLRNWLVPTKKLNRTPPLPSHDKAVTLVDARSATSVSW